MKKSMILGLCITLVASFLMLGGIVRAEEVSQPSVSVDKDSQVKEGNVITVTVSYDEENSTGIFLTLSVDNDTFELISVKGLDSQGKEVRLAGNGNHYSYEKSMAAGSFNQGIYKVSAAMTNGDKIQSVELKVRAKKDITRDTAIIVKDIAKTVIASDSFKSSKKIPIKALTVEPEPETPPNTPTPENPSTTSPSTTPTPEKPAERDETPDTGLVDVALIASIVSVISLAGVVAVKKYSK